MITIDHPPVNALSAPLLEELEAEIERLDADDGVRAIVLRGAGERAFVAGADISEFPSLRAAADEAHEGGSARGIQKLGHRMDAAHTPFVAAIHGFCLGGGLELAMCCDIRVAAEEAQLGQPEIKLGLIPGGGGTQRLPRLVGLGRAQLLNMTGDFIDADGVRVGARREGRAPGGAARGCARHRADDRGPVARLDRRAAGWRDARRWRKVSAARPTASAAASRARTAPRESQRSSRSASRSSPVAEGSDPMRAVVLEATGGPEQLVVQDVPAPDAGEGTVIVDVRAAGINFADVLIRLGRYPQMPELPVVLGSEIAGELDGKRVMGFVRSEEAVTRSEVAVDRRWLLPLPAGASFAEGAFRWPSSPHGSPLSELVRIAFGARV